MRDPIVEEVHRRRVAHAEAFGHGIDAMVEDLKRRERISRSRGVKFVTPRKRKKLQPG
jgi:hypothetical protein